MAENVIEIVVKTTDHTGPGFDSAGRGAGRLGGIIGGFAKTAALGLAGVTVAAVAMGVGFVKSAEESNQVSRQTEAVITSMGNAAKVSADEVAGLSEKLSEKTGIDDEVIQSGENVLLTFANVRNEVGEGNKIFDRATTAALDMSVALGQDMQSSVTQLGKALNDPIAGITALTRVGIQFTDQQKEQIKTLVESGDVLGAQQIILAEVERQFSGSAEAQATASGKMQVAWDNLSETLGAKLLPIFQAAATWITDTGIPAIEALAAWVETRAMPVIATWAANIRDDVLPTLQAFGAWIVDELVPKLQALWAMIQDQVLPVYADLAAEWRDNVGPAIAGLVSALASLTGGTDDATRSGQHARDQFKLLGAILEGASLGPRIFARAIELISDAAAWAIRQVGRLRDMVNSLPGGGGISSVLGIGGALPVVGRLFKASGGIVGAASGGMRSGLTMVGEHGSELVDIPAGSRVHGNAMTEGMLARSGGGGTVVLRIEAGNTPLDQLLLEVLRKAIQVDHGGDVQLALGITR